jgi:hypothetical protein
MTGFAGEAFIAVALAALLLGGAMIAIARRPRTHKVVGLHRR